MKQKTSNTLNKTYKNTQLSYLFCVISLVYFYLYFCVFVWYQSGGQSDLFQLLICCLFHSFPTLFNFCILIHQPKTTLVCCPFFVTKLFICVIKYVMAINSSLWPRVLYHVSTPEYFSSLAHYAMRSGNTSFFLGYLDFSSCPRTCCFSSHWSSLHLFSYVLL